MGCCLATSSDEEQGNELSEKKVFLIGYCVWNGDIRRITSGYDDCGYVCGHVTGRTTDICPGDDKTYKPLVMLLPQSSWNMTKRECVDSCDIRPNYRQFLNRCILKNEEHAAYKFFEKLGIQGYFQEVAEDIILSYREIIYLCVIALALSLVLVFLFRYFAGILVWFVLGGIILGSISVTGYLWHLWYMKHYNFEQAIVDEVHERKVGTYFVFATIATIVTIIIGLMIFSMRRSIELVSKLFEEAGKAISAMPLLLLQPFISFLAIVFTLFVWAYCHLWIESAGHPALKHTTNTRVTYRKNEIIQLARVYNVVAIFWILEFIIGCQHMIISGATATWFFTRKRKEVKEPISKSYFNLFNYHLGTVAIGSLLIAIVQIIRALFSLFSSSVKDAKNDFTKSVYKACHCCLYCLEKVLVFITRNAYIEVAIYGDNLWKSGHRAYSVLTANSLRVIAINSVGDFILFLGKALVVLCTIFLGIKFLEGKEGIHYLSAPLVIVGIFAYFVSNAFMIAFEMVIDTIFICFCEDCELNDGISRPYYMSKDLMEFVERSQKVLKVGDAADGPPRSQAPNWGEN